MASCENCHMRGIDPKAMRVRQFEQEELLIGPCCTEAPRMHPQVDYHFEVSSKNGIVASVEYAGLRLEYKKSPEQIREKFSKPQPTQQAVVH
jgi:hypothetical protein